MLPVYDLNDPSTSNLSNHFQSAVQQSFFNNQQPHVMYHDPYSSNFCSQVQNLYKYYDYEYNSTNNYSHVPYQVHDHGQQYYDINKYNPRQQKHSISSILDNITDLSPYSSESISQITNVYNIYSSTNSKQNNPNLQTFYNNHLSGLNISYPSHIYLSPQESFDSTNIPSEPIDLSIGKQVNTDSFDIRNESYSAAMHLSLEVLPSALSNSIKVRTKEARESLNYLFSNTIKSTEAHSGDYFTSSDTLQPNKDDFINTRVSTNSHLLDANSSDKLKSVLPCITDRGFEHTHTKMSNTPSNESMTETSTIKQTDNSFKTTDLTNISSCKFQTNKRKLEIKPHQAGKCRKRHKDFEIAKVNTLENMLDNYNENETDDSINIYSYINATMSKIYQMNVSYCKQNQKTSDFLKETNLNNIFTLCCHEKNKNPEKIQLFESIKTHMDLNKSEKKDLLENKFDKLNVFLKKYCDISVYQKYINYKVFLDKYKLEIKFKTIIDNFSVLVNCLEKEMRSTKVSKYQTEILYTDFFVPLKNIYAILSDEKSINKNMWEINRFYQCCMNYKCLYISNKKITCNNCSYFFCLKSSSSECFQYLQELSKNLKENKLSVTLVTDYEKFLLNNTYQEENDNKLHEIQDLNKIYRSITSLSVKISRREMKLIKRYKKNYHKRNLKQKNFKRELSYIIALITSKTINNINKEDKSDMLSKTTIDADVKKMVELTTFYLLRKFLARACWMVSYKNDRKKKSILKKLFKPQYGLNSLDIADKKKVIESLLILLKSYIVAKNFINYFLTVFDIWLKE